MPRFQAAQRSSNRKNRKSNKTVRINAPTQEIGRAISIPAIKTNQRQARIVQWDDTPHPLVSSTTVPINNVFTFVASALADSSVFSAFEAYKIVKVDILYKPNNPIGSTSATAAGFGGWVAFDPDDNATNTVAALASKQHSMVQSLLESWEVTIQPRPTPAVYAGGVFSGYEVGRSMWIDSDNLNVAHFGFKTSFPATPAVTGGAMYFRYHVDVIMNE
jgi:hypothetical protein